MVKVTKNYKKNHVMYLAVVLNSGNILESRLVNKSFSLDEEFLHIPEEDFIVLIFFWIVRIFAVEKNMDQFISVIFVNTLFEHSR